MKHKNSKLLVWILIILSFIILGNILSNLAKEYDNYSLPYKESSYDSYVNLSSGDIILFKKIGGYNNEYGVYVNSDISKKIFEINEYNQEFGYENYQIKVKGINTNNHLLDVEVWNKKVLYYLNILNFFKEFL